MTALELIKSRDSMQSLILFMKSDEAQRVMAAWQLFGVVALERALKKNETFERAKDALWNSISFDVDVLADLADVPATRCRLMITRLKKANVIYPDGTISQHASNLLVSTAIAHVRGLAPKGKAYEPTRINTGRADVHK